MKKFLIYLMVFVMALIWVPSVFAEEFLPPPRDGSGVIGGQKNQAWRLGIFKYLRMNGVTYTWPGADGVAGTHLQTNGAGTLSWGAAGTPTMDTVGDPAADVTLVYADNFTDLRTFADTNEDMFNIRGIGAFGDVSVVRIDQITGNPTDGTVLEIVAADPNVDPLVVSASTTARALVVGQNTGVVTIAGVAEGTTALEIALGDINLTDGDINVIGGDATFSEDVTITGNLIGGTGLINYTNFDVDAAGNVISLGNITAVDGTFSGNVAVTGTFLQEHLAPPPPGPTTITLDGIGTGGVSIGTISGTGTITMGGGGFGTLVNLPATVDLVLAGGDLTVTDTANADMVTFTNNTLTTNDLLTLAAGGTRTSNNVLSITDLATTASTVGIVANAATSADVISVTADALNTGTMLLLDSDGIPAATYYLRAFDGVANDLTIGANGAVVIAGLASTNVLTVTTGDVQIDDGLLEIDTDEDDMTYIKRNQGATTKPAFKVWEAAAAADNAAVLIDQDATAAASYGLEIESAGGTGIHLNLQAAAGDGVLIDVANSYTGQGIVADLGPWLGTTGEGFVAITSDSGAVNEVGQAIRVNLQGTGTAGTAVTGKALYAHSQAAVKAGESLVFLDTLTNTALHINNEGAAADGIKFDVANTYTGQGILADLGPWTGTAGEGFIELNSDNAATIPAGQFIRMRQLGTGQHAAAIGGTVLFMEDDAVAPAAGTSYMMYMDATNIEAIHVDTGKVLVDETVTATGGLSAGSSAGSLLRTDTITIPSADVKTLNATPYVLIASPGANAFIEVVSAVMYLDYSTAVFVVAGDSDFVIEYGTSNDDITGSIEGTGWLDAGVDQVVTYFPTSPQASNAMSDIVNNTVEIFNTGTEIAGDAGGNCALIIKITYRVHPWA